MAQDFDASFEEEVAADDADEVGAFGVSTGKEEEENVIINEDAVRAPDEEEEYAASEFDDVEELDADVYSRYSYSDDDEDEEAEEESDA